jgi:hypothetical protein
MKGLFAPFAVEVPLKPKPPQNSEAHLVIGPMLAYGKPSIALCPRTVVHEPYGQRKLVHPFKGEVNESLCPSPSRIKHLPVGMKYPTGMTGEPEALVETLVGRNHGEHKGPPFRGFPV